MKTIVVTACGYVDSSGFGSARRRSAWPSAGGTPPAAPRWRTFSNVPCDRFGRLDRLSKQAIIAVELLGLPPCRDGAARPDVAISLGTPQGSVDVDSEFARSMGQPGGASPALFSYTLPSAPVAEIAIRHQVTGPGLCLMAGPQSGLVALWEGYHLVADEEARACICVGCDAAPGAAPFAYAVLVETEASRAADGRRPLAEIGVRAASAATGAGASDSPQNEPLRTLCEWLASARPSLCLPAPAAVGASLCLAVVRR